MFAILIDEKIAVMRLSDNHMQARWISIGRSWAELHQIIRKWVSLTGISDDCLSLQNSGNHQKRKIKKTPTKLAKISRRNSAPGNGEFLPREVSTVGAFLFYLMLMNNYLF